MPAVGMSARGKLGGLAVSIVVGMFIVATPGMSGASTMGSSPRPTVSSFVANPETVLSDGGEVTLSANVTNATSCTFSSNKPVSGLPTTIPCANGAVEEGLTLLANTGKRAAKYKFKLTVAGSATVKADATGSVATLVCSNIQPDANLQKCSLPGVILPDADLPGAVLVRANLAGATLSDANLSQANMPVSNFSDVDLDGADLWDAILTDVQLAGSNLSGSNLSDTHLADTKMSDDNLTSANMQSAYLAGTDLEGADLSDADMSGAFVTGENLTGVVWSNTICPDGTNSNNDGGTCANNLGS
jgi:uncharacterized protein YjbI with pentapeptide repeats